MVDETIIKTKQPLQRNKSDKQQSRDNVRYALKYFIKHTLKSFDPTSPRST